jgi:hypothetical protein
VPRTLKDESQELLNARVKCLCEDCRAKIPKIPKIRPPFSAHPIETFGAFPQEKLSKKP